MLIVRAKREWETSRPAGIEAFVLLTVLLYFLVVSALLYMVHPWYWLPTLLFGTVMSGVGVGAVADHVCRCARTQRALVRGKALE